MNHCYAVHVLSGALCVIPDTLKLKYNSKPVSQTSRAAYVLQKGCFGRW